MAKSFSPTFESLHTYECPDWFRDAKFGIWSHWGPQSVPMYGDWYARNMYVEDSPQYLYHLRHYGHPSEFGYKDLAALWKAESFNPDELMELYHKAGARYFVAQAMHHDHFFNYESKLNHFNSVNVGPKKDIVRLWSDAAKKFGLPFGVTEHLGATFSWWNVNKRADKKGPYAGIPYDGNDPASRDIYLDNYEHVFETDNPQMHAAWYTTNKRFHEYWLSVMNELIDHCKPDLLYSDGPLPFGAENSVPGDEEFKSGLSAVAHLYNTSVSQYGENRAVYTQKDRREEIYSVGVLDIEKSQLPGINPRPWQTDTCVGNWFYDVRQPFKTAGHVVEMLVDIISKNGTMLLNILQRPDGSIDRETRHILDGLAAWFSVCAEGVHGSRPWEVFGEGDGRVLIKGFTEEQVNWTSGDYRFTHKGNTLYAFIMNAPENRVSVIKSIGPDRAVKSVRLLGHGDCAFSCPFGILNVKLPDKMPVDNVNCLAIELE